MSTPEHTSGTSPKHRRRWWIIGSAGTALVVIAAGGLIWWNIDSPDHRTTSALDEHPLAQTASQQGWEWTPPEGKKVVGVMPIPSGVAVQLYDGVIALDGVTGEPTWHYRRQEPSLRAAFTTEDTAHIALTFGKKQADSRRPNDPRIEDLLLLDTSTGRIVAEQEIEEVGRERSKYNPVEGAEGARQALSAAGIHHLTDDARIEFRAGFTARSLTFRAGFTARSLTDGTTLWQNDTVFPWSDEDDSISDAYLGQTAVVGNTIFAGRSTVSSRSGLIWDYELIAMNADTGELRWEQSWPIGDGRYSTDPTFTLGPNTLALRLYIEEQGRVMDLETGEELSTDPWPEEGGLLALTEDGYVAADQSFDDRGMYYHDHDGELRHRLDPDGVNLEGNHTLALPTTESFIALGPDPDDTDDAGRGLLTVDDWETGERTASLPVDWTPRGNKRLTTSIVWSAETTPFLRQAPGAIIALDRITGQVSAFTP
ncbi:hypothetical protein [Nocardiopsis sp. MG754419]|uniref:hypothetical protein n=1 Tax=Nocardiopsis sp. MG754419 TaxID=2259865 RepID=UPI001BA7960C|nr:hypothetical protein [Nocardiopsis sp. MG754419]MBR8741655.1 hypothetical protein [Nocardiopsis sp. MG754419]